ncbi:hypothetical protein Gogos_017416, partial [Gossypium gossypioides]|nr:hypothetical protein [Gossypium gossypioides]
MYGRLLFQASQVHPQVREANRHNTPRGETPEGEWRF